MRQKLRRQDISSRWAVTSLRADEIGHEVMLPGGEAFDAIVAAFGTGVLDAAGRDRSQALATEVFDSPERLAQLNAIVHPAVIRKEEEFLRGGRTGGPLWRSDCGSRHTDRNGELPPVR